MKEKLISFETAKLAKEKGYKGKIGLGYKYRTGDYYNHIGVLNGDCTTLIKDIIKAQVNKDFLNPINFNISAPTQSLLQKWLREVHKIDLYIETVWSDFEKNTTEYVPWIMYPKELDHLEDEEPIYYKTYEEALELALVEALNLIKIKKRFYRVCNEDSLRGLWYDFKGEFTGAIHDDFNFCANSSLKMDFDPEIVGWLSATDSLEDLYKWFTIEDISRLQNFGWYIHEFEAEDYKFYERFQHIIIKQDTSTLIKKIEL